MKYILKSYIYVMMGILWCLSACMNEEVSTPVAEEYLKVKVEDAGYISAEPLEGRTAADGFKTTFTEGDLIGIFTVVNGEVKQRNVGMLYSNDVEGWVGILKKETEPDARYYAYYPWREDLVGEVNPNATTAAEFFKDVVNHWEVPTDQNTYTKYSAYDLMTGEGSVQNGNELSFSLSHQMGLVLIQMPMVRYKFTNSNPVIGDYIIPAKGTEFSGVDPCMLYDGSYRFLVKPNVETSFSGGYLKDGVPYQFTASVTLESGKYKKYRVDGGTVEERNHQLQFGDFYMKDGSLVGKDTQLSEQQKMDCVGVVYWVGDMTKEDPILKKERANCRHGLVCSLRDGNNLPWHYAAKKYNQTVQHWVAENTYGFRNLVTGAGPQDNMNQMLGYNNTMAMELFNLAPENDSYKLQIIEHLQNFRNNHFAPDFTSGWFLPSIKELYVLLNEDISDIHNINPPSSSNLKKLNTILSNLSETYADPFNSKAGVIENKYYSSSEHNVYKVWCLNSDISEYEGGIYYRTEISEDDKEYIYHTRFILAF